MYSLAVYHDVYEKWIDLATYDCYRYFDIGSAEMEAARKRVVFNKEFVVIKNGDLSKLNRVKAYKDDDAFWSY